MPHAFNGGPGNCPAKPRRSSSRQSSHVMNPAFNGGPGNCPAKLGPHGPRSAPATSMALQWRAGQLPGQTSRRCTRSSGAAEAGDASMEGRAIARPNTRPSALMFASTGGADPSMEGRAIARPNGGLGRDEPGLGSQTLQWRAGQLPGQTSLCNTILAQSVVRSGFNGGPGNCPAKREAACCCQLELGDVASMEGRAIARPNNPVDAVFTQKTLPSMEGRAIARPNPDHPAHPALKEAFLQWRAGQLPGQTMHGQDVAPARTSSAVLQWRAGQLPGQTTRRASRAMSTSVIPALQWRAGQLPGQT